MFSVSDVYKCFLRSIQCSRFQSALPTPTAPKQTLKFIFYLFHKCIVLNKMKKECYFRYLVRHVINIEPHIPVPIMNINHAIKDRLI
ncbi:hypothetical protein HanRHA438_Chr16g0747651 [Helianthus annuus]|nr:hypothetical protein HanPSC8_Chr16g0705251 [Helianthus annuus]KAJ0834787.1 hypothetical protein HanRHA438_Chr16g0747651 [Helianthus annuus]